MFKFLIKTGVAAEAEFKKLLADAKKGVVDWAEYLLKISDKLDERTIKAFEELHAAIEAEEIKLAPAPTGPATAGEVKADPATPGEVKADPAAPEVQS